MIIYEYERKDGLSDQLHDNRIVIASALDLVDVEQKILAYANPNQEDLFYLESVLASVGWNNNDDVFLKEEMWLAKDTPKDKLFNLMHDEKEIIGHITSSRVISDGEVVSPDTPIDRIPDQFDIVVGSVIYRKFNTKSLQERANKLIAEIKEGKWFVSMECWPSSFDYVLKAPSGEQKIIARNENTSFLTKYLRRYKGTGEYEGCKIARALRDYYFSGKGLVNNPANKKSVFVSYSDTNEKIAAEEQVMSTYTEAQFKELEVKLEAAEKKAKEVLDKAVSKEIDEYKVKVQSLENQLKVESDTYKTEVEKLTVAVKALEDKLTVALEVEKNKDEQIKALTEAKNSLEAKVNEHTEAMKKIEAEKTKASRLAKLATVDVAEDKAQALVDKFANVTDEVFDTLVGSFPAKKTSAKINTEVLDVEDDEPVLAVANTDEVKQLRTAVSTWLKQGFKK